MFEYMERPEGQLTRPNRPSGDSGEARKKTRSRARLFAVSLVAIVGFVGAGFIGASPASAWSFDASVSVKCSAAGTVEIDGKATNTETSPDRDMMVTMRYGTSSDGPKLAGHQGGENNSTVYFKIDTGDSSVGSGKVNIDLSWTNGRYGTDTKVRYFSALSCTKPDTPVVAAPAEFNDDCGIKNDYTTLIATEGVQYRLNGKIQPAGVHHAEPGLVEVEAEALAGHVLKGDHSWSHTFTDKPCEVPPPVKTVTAAAVTSTQGYAKCLPDGKVKIVAPSVTIPKSPGVVYLVTTPAPKWEGLGIVAPDTYYSKSWFGETVYYRAESSDGTPLVGKNKWKITFSELSEAPECVQPPTGPMPETGVTMTLPKTGLDSPVVPLTGIAMFVVGGLLLIGLAVTDRRRCYDESAK